MGRSGREAIVEVAFLFPGQGSQEPGMLHDLTPGQGTEAVLREMSGTLGFDVLSLDTAGALKSTSRVQLSLLASGVATARQQQDHDGHVHAGAIASQADSAESCGTDVCREKGGRFALTALIEPLSNPCLGRQILVSALESGGDDGARPATSAVTGTGKP